MSGTMTTVKTRLSKLEQRLGTEADDHVLILMDNPGDAPTADEWEAARQTARKTGIWIWSIESGEKDEVSSEA